MNERLSDWIEAILHPSIYASVSTPTGAEQMTICKSKEELTAALGREPDATRSLWHQSGMAAAVAEAEMLLLFFGTCAGFNDSVTVYTYNWENGEWVETIGTFRNNTYDPGYLAVRLKPKDYFQILSGSTYSYTRIRAAQILL